MNHKIIVFGSISTDFVVTTDRRPQIGETVTGLDFTTTFGGKGANQAVACARLGAEVHMVGTVGTDLFGEELLKNLQENKVSIDNVERVTHAPSGSAHIIIAGGDNSITYVPGANNEIGTPRIRSLEAFIQEAGMIIIQNEMPQVVVDEIINISYENNVSVLYNPAPARKVNSNILEKATFISPNENEFHELFPDLSISQGLEKYSKQLILTMGSKGVYFHDGDKEQRISAYKVKPMDTTGAGDTFNGAFAVAMVNGLSIEESIKFGNLAASLSIQKFGAQGGMPTIEEMRASENFEEKWNIK